MRGEINRIVRFVLETDLPGEDDLTKSVEGSLEPDPNSELAGIAKWVRDANNSAGCGDKGWTWDEDSMVLTITNEDDSVSEIPGSEIYRSGGGDPRLERLRGASI